VKLKATASFCVKQIMQLGVKNHLLFEAQQACLPAKAGSNDLAETNNL
jgi:hypothetical protein